MKRINIKGLITVIGFVALITGAVYADYVIYKAKYPNTTFWMWVMDSK